MSTAVEFVFFALLFAALAARTDSQSKCSHVWSIVVIRAFKFAKVLETNVLPVCYNFYVKSLKT